MDGSCKSLFPILIYQNNCILKPDRSANRILVSAKYDHDWRRAGLF